jgi:hypothetical protein
MQRRVMLARPASAGGGFAALTQRRRGAFLRRHFGLSRRFDLARRILDDMADAGSDFNFSSEAELVTELQKRVATAVQMRRSQGAEGGRRAFGYPFSRPSLYWGPRVNVAARDYWLPAVVDDYDERRDPATRAAIEGLPRNRRHTVLGDPAPGYHWILSPLGHADPYAAITSLFEAQPPHKRTLIHCDYLVSLVHFLSFATAVGRAEFNRRLRTHGLHRIQLRWNGFADLQLDVVQPDGSVTPGLGSLQVVRPASERDLVIGDHVYFWNHLTYDLINERIGNAWRLENAVLVDRRGGEDRFLGHGSGEKTAHQMRSKLAEEYNDVAQIALRLIARTRSRVPARRGAAQRELADRFPNLHPVGPAWHIVGDRFGQHFDQRLRLIRSDEVLGLRDPWDPSRLFEVRRPAESR